jgi:hypothetical protein
MEGDAAGAGDAAPGGSAAIPQKAATEDGMSIWDLITQACELCGVLPIYNPSLPEARVDPDTGEQIPNASTHGQEVVVDPKNCLLLMPAEAFYDDIDRGMSIVGGSRDGFSRPITEGAGSISHYSDVRVMMWGHNIRKLKFARKLGKVRPTAVEVRSYNPDAAAHLRVLSARYPAHTSVKKRGAKMHEKGKGKIDTIKTYVLKGIRDIQALETAAAAIYQQITRHELTVELETNELASFIDPSVATVSHNEQPDILRLSAGSPVKVVVAQQSEQAGALSISTLSEFYSKFGSDIAGLLMKQNDRWGQWNKSGKLDQSALAAVAGKIQAAYSKARIPDVFYCRAVRMHFSEEGFDVKMELANYMDSADPKYMDKSDQEISDRRKKVKTSPKAKAEQKAKLKGDAITESAVKAANRNLGRAP